MHGDIRSHPFFNLAHRVHAFPGFLGATFLSILDDLKLELVNVMFQLITGVPMGVCYDEVEVEVDQAISKAASKWTAT